MSDNTGQIDLSNLGTTSSEELDTALQGQPETVKPEEVEIEEDLKEKKKPAGDTFDDGLGHMSYTDKDGYARMHNRSGSFVGGDLDQFGHRTMVTGLDKGFTFSGWDDTSDRSQEAQGSWEKLLNGVLQFGGDTVLETTKGLMMLPGAVNAIVQGDFTAMYDNAAQRGIDSFQEDYDKYFEIKRGGNQTGLQKTSNFLFDDVLGAMSFVVGAVATEAILSAATAATLGGAAPAQAAATAGIAARGARIAKAILSGGKRVLKGQFIDDAVKGFQALGAASTRKMAQKGIMEAGAKGARIASINGAGKLGRQILTGGGMEAGVEARHMMNAAGENHKRQYEDLYGADTYTTQMEEDFRKTIGGEADAVFGTNLALVSISNMLMFPRLFGVSLRSGMKTVKTVPKSSLSAAGRRKAAKAFGTTEEALPDLLDASRGTAWGRNLRRTAGLRVGLYEGFVEEGGQGTIGRGAEHYIAEKYNPANTKQTANMTEAFLTGLEGSYTTADGFKEIGIGFALGLLGVPNVLRMSSQKADGTTYTPKMLGGSQARKDANAIKDKAVNDILNLHKKHGDVVSILEAELHNVNIQKGLVSQADAAYENNDFKQAKDIEADQIFAHATSKITTGRYDDAIQESKEILDDMSVEDYRELLGEEGMNMSDNEVRARKEEVHASYVTKMAAVKESFDAASVIYKGENPDIHAGVANMIYNIKDRDAREKYIADAIAKKLETHNGDQILDASRMASELGITATEITEMTALDTKIKRIEKQLKTKMERNIIKNINPEKAEKRASEIDRIVEELKVAQDKSDKLNNAIFSRKDIEGTYDFDIEKQEARLQGLIDMNHALAAVGKDVTSISQQGLTEDVLDLMEVTRDRKRLLSEYNDLIKPGGYGRFLGRMQGAIADLQKETAEEKADREKFEFDQRQQEAYAEEERLKQAKKEEGVTEDLNTDEYVEDVDYEIIKDPSTDITDETNPFSDLTVTAEGVIQDELYTQEGTTPPTTVDVAPQEEATSKREEKEILKKEIRERMEDTYRQEERRTLSKTLFGNRLAAEETFFSREYHRQAAEIGEEGDFKGRTTPFTLEEAEAEMEEIIASIEQAVTMNEIKPGTRTAQQVIDIVIEKYIDVKNSTGKVNILSGITVQEAHALKRYIRNRIDGNIAKAEDAQPASEEVVIPKKILDHLEAIEVSVAQNTEISNMTAINLVMGIKNHFEIKQTSRTVTRAVEARWKPSMELLHERGYKASNFTNKALPAHLKLSTSQALIEYVEDTNLNPGETKVKTTRRPQILLGNNIVQYPSLLVAIGPSIEDDKPVSGDPIIMDGETGPLPMTLDDPLMDATVNKQFPEGAREVLLNGLPVGAEIILEAGSVYKGMVSINIMYGGKKIGYISPTDIGRGEHLLSPEVITAITKDRKKVRTTVSAVTPTELGGSKIHGKARVRNAETGQYEDTFISNRGKAIEKVHTVDDVKQVVYFISKDGKTGLQDAIENKEVTIEIPPLKKSDLSTSGRHYMVIEDHNTKKDVWIALDGDLIGDAEANFIYQAAMVVDVQNGMRTLEEVGMTQESFDASLKVLEDFGLGLVKAKLIPTNEEIKLNKNKFVDLLQRLTGYTEGKSATYTTKPFLNRKEGIHLDIFKGVTNEDGSPGVLDIKTYDLENTERLSDMPSGTSTNDSSVVKIHTSSEHGKEPIVRALARKKKSATTQGRNAYLSHDVVEWPLTLTTGKDNQLIAQNKVPFKDWNLNRLFVTERAPIKETYKGKNVLIASNIESINLQVEEIIEESAEENTRGTQALTPIPTDPPAVDHAKILKDVAARKETKEDELLMDDDYDYFPGNVNNIVKKGVHDVFRMSPNLSSIGTPAQYSAYLETIFPDSKTKDIFTVSTRYDLHKDPEAGIQRLIADSRATNRKYGWPGGYVVYEGHAVSPYKETSQWKDYKVLINPKDDYTEDVVERPSQSYRKGGYRIAVAKRMLVLGSNQDMQGFKKFVQESEIDYYPGSAQLDLFPASEGKTPNKLNRVDLAGQTVSVTVKVKSRTDAEANSLGTYTEEQALGLGKKAMNRAAKEWTTSEEVTFDIKFGEEATPKGKLASTSTLNASQQKKVEALIDNMNGFPNEQLPLSNFLGITGKLGSLQKAKMQGLELTIAPLSQPTSEAINIYAGTGENASLSNFAERQFKYKGLDYVSVEEAFQIAKKDYFNTSSIDPSDTTTTPEMLQAVVDEWVQDIFNAKSSAEKKKIGGKSIGVDFETYSWDQDSSKIMKDIMRESFTSDSNARAKLLATGNATLTHTQDKGKWGKEFPKILMEIREELRGTQPTSEVDINKLEYAESQEEVDSLIARGYMYAGKNDDGLPAYSKPTQPASEVKSIPMQPDNIAKILSGEKTTTLRTNNLPSGVYNIGGQEFTLTNRGLLSIEEAGGVSAITKSEVFAKSGPKFSSTKDFLVGKKKLYVIDIVPIQPTSVVDDSVTQDIPLPQVSQATPSPAVSTGTNMDRAGKLYGVEGMNARQVAMTVNIMAGMAAGLLLTHSRTTKRRNSLTAEDMSRNIRTILEGKLEKLRSFDSTPGIEKKIAFFEKVLEPTRFRKLMLHSVLEVLRVNQGTIKSGGVKVGDVLSEILEEDSGTLVKDESITEDDIANSDNPLAAFDDNFAFGMDPAKTLRFELKMLLLSTQHLVKNADTFTPFGELKYVDFGTMIENLNETLTGLAGQEYNWKSVHGRLEGALNEYPYFKAVIQALDYHNNPEVARLSIKESDKKRKHRLIDSIKQMRQQLITFGAKDSARFMGMVLEPATAPDASGVGGTSARVFTHSSNHKDLFRAVGPMATAKLLGHHFYKINKETENIEANPKVIKEFLAALDEITTAEHDHSTKAGLVSKVFYDKLGIKIPPSVFKDTEMDQVSKDFTNDSSAESIFGQFRDSLRNLTLEDADLSVDILVGDRTKSGQKLFVMAAKYDRTFIQNSSRDISGKVRHQHSAPKLITQRLNEIKMLKGESDEWVDGAGIGGKKGNYLIEELKQVTGREKMQLDYVDGMNIVHSSNDAKGFHGMTTSDRNLASLVFFGNSTEEYIGNKIMWSRHMLPTIGDKHTMPLLNGPTIVTQMETGENVLATADMLLEDLTIGQFVSDKEFGKYYNKYIRPAIDMEITRINHIRTYRRTGETNGLTTSQLEAEAFIFLPELTAFLPHDLELVTSDIAELHKKAKEILHSSLTVDLQHMLESLDGTVLQRESSEKFANSDSILDSNKGGRVIGLSYLDPSQEEFRYVADHLKESFDEVKTHEKKVSMLFTYIAKYTLDAHASKINSTMMFVGDPGAFWKGDAESTMDNTGKRLASMIAPGNVIPEVNWTERQPDGSDKNRSNKTINILPLPDKFIVSQHMEFLESLGLTKDELKTMRSIEATDGAEFVTAEEHLGVLLAQGKISEFAFLGLLGKAKDPNATFDDVELGYFNPMKPVITGRQKGGHLIYIKSAQFPLVAAFTKNSELDKLRVFMEQNNFQRASHLSAFKVGNTIINPVKIYNENGVIDVSNPKLKNQRVTTPRHHMRIQQEQPVGKSKIKVHGSQVAKGVLAALTSPDVKGFALPQSDSYNSSVEDGTYSGEELHTIYMEARNKELQLKTEAFGDKYGLKIKKQNGEVSLEGTLEYKRKLAARMFEEAISRGYEANEIAHLFFDEAKGEFATPLWASLSEERINSLILSIFYKEVLQPRIAGFSGPIRPEPGIAFDSLTKEEQNAIVYVTQNGEKLFNGSRLKTLQRKEDGTMQPDQIIMPWVYAGKLEEYTLPDGTLDMSKMPQELLDVFAYRIPNQSKASSGSFQVVGFLPKEYGDTLVVPAELVGRMGQDYDIDKLFGMLYAIKTDKDTGVMEILREENAKTIEEKIAAERNTQIDVYHSTMRNPSDVVQKEINRPVGDGYGKQLSEMTDKGSFGLLPMSIAYNNQKAESARAAKKGIGVFAATGVTHAQLEQVANRDARGHFGKTSVFMGSVGHTYVVVTMDNTRRPEQEYDSYEAFEAHRKTLKNDRIGGSIAEVSRLGKTMILDTEFVLEKEGYEPEAGTIQDQYTRLINHSVDNENNHLLSKLGIHEESFAFWTAMTEMGYNEETIAMMAQTPIARKFFQQRAQSRSFGSTSAVQPLIKNLMEEGGFEKMEDVHMQINFNKETLKTQFLNEADSGLDKQDDIAHSIHILQAIATAEEANKGWRSMQKSMKLDTRLPKNRNDFFKLMADTAAFTLFQYAMQDPEFPGQRFNVIMGPPGKMDGEAWSSTKRDTVAGSITTQAERLYADLIILDGEHIENTAFSETLRKALEAGRAEGNFGDIIKQLKSYLSAKWAEDLTGRSAIELRAEFLDSDVSNIALQIVNAAAAHPKEIGQNVFVKQLIPELDKKKYSFHTLEFTGDRSAIISTAEMQAAYLDLVQSETLAVRKFAETLFIYDLVTGGTLSSRGYGKYIAAEYLQDMPDPITRQARPELGIRSQFDPSIAMFRNGISSPEARSALGQIFRHKPDLAPKREVNRVRYINKITGKSATGFVFDIESNENEESLNLLYQLGHVYSKGTLYTVTGVPIMREVEDENTPGEILQVKSIIVKPTFESPQVNKKMGDYLNSQYSAKGGVQNKPERKKSRTKDTYDDAEVGMDLGMGEFGGEITDKDGNVVEDIEANGGMKDVGEVAPDGDFLYPIPDGAEERLPGDPTPVPLENHVPLQGAIDALFPDTSNFILHWALEHEKGLPVEQRIKLIPGEHSYMGSFNNRTRTVRYNKKFISPEQLAHEFVHAYTVDPIENPKKYSPEIAALLKEIEDTRTTLIGSEEHLKAMGVKNGELQMYQRGHNVYTKAQRMQVQRADMVKEGYTTEDIQAYDFYHQGENQERLHGFVNMREFMSEALTNPIFAKQLNKVKLGKDSTLYEAFLDYISELLKKLGVIPKGETAATLVVRNTMQVMEAVAKERGVPLKLKKPKADTSALGDDTKIGPDSIKDTGKFVEKDIETLKSYKKKRIRQFNEVKARFKDNAKLVRGANQRIALERFELNSLGDSVLVTDVVDFANRELDNVERILTGTNVSGANMNEMQSAIQDTLSVIEFYENFRDLSSVSSEGRKQLAQLQARAKNLRSEYLTMSRSLLRAFAKKRFKGTEAEEFVNSDSFLEMENISSLSTWFMDASRQGRIEFSFLDKVIKDANAEQRLDYSQRLEAYNEISAEFKETEYFKKHGWNGIVQLDVDGNPTPQIISPLGEVWDRQLEARRKKAIETDNWAPYYKWRDANTGSVNVNQMYKIVDGEVIRTNNPAILRQLEKQFGKLGAQELLKRQDILMQQYVDFRQSEFDQINMNYHTEKTRDKAKAEWETKNSPGAFYTYKTSTKRSPKGSKDRFLYHMPLQTKGGKSTGFYDTRFSELQSEPAAVKYYEHMRSEFTEMMSMLPMHDMGADAHLLQNGLFLPALRKQMTLDFWDIPGKLRNLKDNFFRAIMSSEQELESNLIDPVTGEIRRELPTSMLNTFADKSEQEYDMDKVFAQFTMMATTYNAKNKIEDIVTMTDAVLNEVGMKHLDGKKDRVTLKGFGLTSHSQERRANILTVVRTLVDDFYGKKVKEPMIMGGKKVVTSEDKAKEANIQDKMNTLQVLYEQGDISDEEFKERSDELNTELSKVGGYVDLAKLIRGVTKFMQLKGMGWNVTAASVNGIYGTMQVFRWAAGREDFDEVSARSAMTVMMGTTLNALTFSQAGDQIKDVKKVQNTMMKLNVLKDFTEVRWDAAKANDPYEGKRWIDKVRPYHLQKTSEYFVYGLAVVSHLKFKKVNGVSLWEAMDEEGIIQIDGYRPGEVEYYRLEAHLDQMNKKIHGNYDPDSPIAVKKTLLGPMLMQFRSWLPEGVAQRGEESKQDHVMGREVKGTFRTFGGESAFTAWKGLPYQILPFIAKKEAIEGLSSVDEANVRKTAASLRQLMWLSLMVVALKNALDDDDDNTSLVYMLNIANRIERDLTFFHNPYSIQQMSQDALPVFKLARDGAKFIEVTAQTMVGDGTIPTGLYAGRYRMLHHGGKLIPFTGAAMKLHHNISTVMD